jgi:hypothetical protein
MADRGLPAVFAHRLTILTPDAQISQYSVQTTW